MQTEPRDTRPPTPLADVSGDDARNDDALEDDVSGDLDIPRSRGAPDWQPVKGEPDWLFSYYQASAWPDFVRRVMNLHKLRPEDQRFGAHGMPIKLPHSRR